ncbi:hypothetical protein BWR19_08455 [Halomonas sp. 1513]|nr:hypothetical protein BWR19_08455 [Halomonas sp. 1513]
MFVRWDAKWGDSVVFSFVPRELRKLGNVSVEVITTPEMAALFREDFGVDVVHEIRKRPSAKEITRLAEQIGPVDLVVFFSHLANHRAIYLLNQLKAKHIAGLDDSLGLIDLKLGTATRGWHFADKYVALLRRCGAECVDTSYLVPRDTALERRATALIAERSRPFICLNAYSKGRARSLTMANCARLAEAVLQRLPGHDVCMLSAPGKEGEVAAFCDAFEGDRVFALAATKTIYENIALIAASAGLVSGITATVHMADGLGVPSLVLFPYDPADRDDWHSRHAGSFNLMAKPSVPIDVNALDWDEVQRAVETFCEGLTS